MKTALREITPKQRAFADALLEGLSPSDAYKRSYDSRSNNAVIAVRACELKKHPGIQAYMRKQQAKLDRTKGLTRTRKRQKLCDIVMDPNSSTSDVIKAIQTDNRMCGDDRAEPVQSFGLSDLLTIVRQRSKQPV